jgi:hypothetical protein
VDGAKLADDAAELSRTVEMTHDRIERRHEAHSLEVGLGAEERPQARFAAEEIVVEQPGKALRLGSDQGVGASDDPDLPPCQPHRVLLRSRLHRARARPSH